MFKEVTHSTHPDIPLQASDYCPLWGCHIISFNGRVTTGFWDYDSFQRLYLLFQVGFTSTKYNFGVQKSYKVNKYFTAQETHLSSPFLCI